jgi:hypothetical protein
VLSNESNPCSVGSSVAYSINALRFILKGMRELPGRKSMMIISDNLPLERQEATVVDFGFKRPVRENANIIDVWTQSTSYRDSFHSLGELAMRASVVIYGITAQQLQSTFATPADEVSFPPQQTRRRPDQRDSLTNLINTRSTELQRNADGAEVLARQTGGFVVRNKNDFGFDRVFEDQSGYYLIGYRPATTTFDRRFHTIQARVKRGGMTVRTRGGFFGVTGDESRAAQPGDRLNHALISPFSSNDIPLRVATYFANDPARGSLLRIFLGLNAKDLTFTVEPDGTHVAKFDLSGVLFGENGAVANRQDQSATLRLRGRPYERALREGLIYGFDWPLKQSGAFQLRVAVRDATSQNVGASGQLIYVPKLESGALALSDILLLAEQSAPSDDDQHAELVMRKFPPGTSLAFGYTIYNASLNKSTRLPKVTTRTLVFRDSVKIYDSDSTFVNTEGQPDLQRISAGARLRLGPALTPGEYVVQILVEDQLSKRTATKLTQFEVGER